MSLQITVPDDKANGLNTPASRQLSETVTAYSHALLNEAGRLEAASRTGDGPPEITSSMIRDADILLRRGYSRPPKSRWLSAAQIGAVVGGFICGFLADAALLRDAPTLVLFIFILTITISATVFTALKD